MPREIGLRCRQEERAIADNLCNQNADIDKIRQALNEFAAKHNIRRLGQTVKSTLRQSGQNPGLEGAWSDEGKIPL